MRKLEINDLIQIAGMFGIIGSLVFRRPPDETNADHSAWRADTG